MYSPFSPICEGSFLHWSLPCAPNTLNRFLPFCTIHVDGGQRNQQPWLSGVSGGRGTSCLSLPGGLRLLLLFETISKKQQQQQQTGEQQSDAATTRFAILFKRFKLMNRVISMQFDPCTYFSSSCEVTYQTAVIPCAFLCGKKVRRLYIPLPYQYLLLLALFCF